jgi:hypothetical protein
LNALMPPAAGAPAPGAATVSLAVAAGAVATVGIVGAEGPTAGCVTALFVARVSASLSRLSSAWIRAS